MKEGGKLHESGGKGIRGEETRIPISAEENAGRGIYLNSGVYINIYMYVHVCMCLYMYTRVTEQPVKITNSQDLWT